MLNRFFRRALVAFIVYYCMMSILQWSPWLADRVKPQLLPVLTESIDFVKVKTVVLNLFVNLSTLESHYDESGILEEAGRDRL